MTDLEEEGGKEDSSHTSHKHLAQGCAHKIDHELAVWLPWVSVSVKIVISKLFPVLTSCNSQLSPSPMASHCPGQACIMLHAGAEALSHCLWESSLFNEDNDFLRTLCFGPLSLGLNLWVVPVSLRIKSQLLGLACKALYHLTPCRGFITQHPPLPCPSFKQTWPFLTSKTAQMVFEPVTPSSLFHLLSPGVALLSSGWSVLNLTWVQITWESC